MSNAMYKRIIHMFVLSCEKATFLIEKQLHVSLSPLEKLQLHIHLSMCKYCTAYKYKAVFLDKLMSDERTKEEKGDQFSEQEVTDLKEKFKSVLRQSNKEKTSQ